MKDELAMDAIDALLEVEAALGTCEYALITGNDADRDDALAAIEEARAALADSNWCKRP